MNKEKQRVKIAEACGFKRGPWAKFCWEKEGYTVTGISNLPDYLNDLNSCHDMEKVLKSLRPESKSSWLAELGAIVGYGHPVKLGSDEFEEMVNAMIHATAPQRCEAFLRVLGLWEEEGE